MRLGSLIRKYKTQLGDSVFSIAGLVLMNAIAQIAVYPFIEKQLGAAGYGDVLYLLAYINIITVSVGCAANLARMTAPAETRMENNGDYHLFLLAVCLLGVPFTFAVKAFGGVKMDTATAVTYYLLFVAMAFRYYADVAYKLTLRFKRYFCYYLAIGVGYVGGIFLFRSTGVWPLALLPGELLGVVLAYLWGNTLRVRAFRPSPVFTRAMRVILLLCVSEGISNLIFNADRLLLKYFVDATAVTVYYLATLVGKMMSLVTTPLNGVLIGYLARFEGKLTRRMMAIISLLSVGVSVLATAACVGGGYVFLLWRYRDTLEAITPYLFVGSLAQVLFFTTSILTVVLIRFAKKVYQIYINGIFGVCFLGIGIPATILWGLDGFAVAIVVTNLIRFATAVLLGFRWARLTAGTDQIPANTDQVPTNTDQDPQKE